MFCNIMEPCIKFFISFTIVQFHTDVALCKSSSSHSTSCTTANRVATCYNYQNVPKDLPANITELVLEKNRIKQLHANALSRYVNLKAVRLDDNGLASLAPGTFIGPMNLETELSLNHNNLTKIVDGVFSKNLHLLESLSISHNRLTSISQHMFDNLTSLERLDLEMNKLSSIHQHAFTKTTKLNFLNLKHNELTTPHSSWFTPLTKMLLASLEYNTWKCDCEITDFKKWIEELDTLKIYKIRCARPASAANRLLREIPAHDLTCQSGNTVVQTKGPTEGGAEERTSQNTQSSSAAAVVTSILVITAVAVAVGIWWFKKKRNSYEGLLSNPSTFQPTLSDVASPGGMESYNTSSEAYL